MLLFLFCSRGIILFKDREEIPFSPDHCGKDQTREDLNVRTGGIRS
jgi:hypothetical protein